HPVISEFELVQNGRLEGRLKGNDAVLRVIDKDHPAAGYPFGLLDVAIVTEEASIKRMLATQPMVQPQGHGSLVKDGFPLKLGHVEKVAARSWRNDHCIRGKEGPQQW